MPRRRGAQPGNANALKHGWYSRAFHTIELQDLDVIEATLQDEIAGLRVAGRRMLELAESCIEPMKTIAALNLYGANCQRVAKILQVHHTLTGGGNDTLAVINEALTEIYKDKHIGPC